MLNISTPPIAYGGYAAPRKAKAKQTNKQKTIITKIQVKKLIAVCVLPQVLGFFLSLFLITRETKYNKRYIYKRNPLSSSEVLHA